MNFKFHAAGSLTELCFYGSIQAELYLIRAHLMQRIRLELRHNAADIRSMVSHHGLVMFDSAYPVTGGDKNMVSTLVMFELEGHRTAFHMMRKYPLQFQSARTCNTKRGYTEGTDIGRRSASVLMLQESDVANGFDDETSLLDHAKTVDLIQEY
ncbi:hypothetical protein BDR06DRAFT_975111 [Suillus hirtellus]|nr:hypothetical protein BDR06DRAFT_975111 [Suillus hirtellus]